MPTIDADAHVLESTKTWSYMRENEQRFRPQIFVRDPNDGAPYRANDRNDFWVIEGRMQTKSNIGRDVPDDGHPDAAHDPPADQHRGTRDRGERQPGPDEDRHRRLAAGDQPGGEQLGQVAPLGGEQQQEADRKSVV